MDEKSMEKMFTIEIIDMVVNDALELRGLLKEAMVNIMEEDSADMNKRLTACNGLADDIIKSAHRINQRIGTLKEISGSNLKV